VLRPKADQVEDVAADDGAGHETKIRFNAQGAGTLLRQQAALNLGGGLHVGVHDFLSCRQLSVCGLQGFTCAHSFGDVAQDAGEDALFPALEFTNRQFHRNDRAVFAPALHLPSPQTEDVGLLGAAIALKISVMVAVVGLWHEHLDVLSLKLLQTVAEGFPSRLVGAANVSELANCENGVHSGFQHGAEPGLAFPQGGFGLDSLADVHD